MADIPTPAAALDESARMASFHLLNKNTIMRLARRIGVLLLGGWSVGTWAAHPLATEDAGTQGQGKFQVEAPFERARATARPALPKRRPVLPLSFPMASTSAPM